MGKKGRHNNRSTKTSAKYRFPIGKLATRRKKLQAVYLKNCQSLQEEKRKVDHVSKRVSFALISLLNIKNITNLIFRLVDYCLNVTNFDWLEFSFWSYNRASYIDNHLA